MNKRLGTRITLRTHSASKVIEKAKTKQIDGILFLHPDRADNLGLLKTKGYLAVYPTVFARRNVSFEHPADFTGKKVAIIDQAYFSQEIIRPYQDKITVLIAKAALEGLRKVDKGEADLFIGASVHSYLLTKYQFFGISPKYVFFEYNEKFGFAIRPDWPDLIPLLKKGKDPYEAKSYRPVALTSCIAKLLERLMRLRVQHFIEKWGLLRPEQAGYRACRSCEEQLRW